MKDFLIVVESPFQLLNSLEYLKSKEIEFDSGEFYLVNSISRINRKQLLATANMFSLNVEVFDLVKRNKLIFHFNLIFVYFKFYFKTQKNDFKFVIYGNSRSDVSLGFVNFFKKDSNIVLVDDGTASLRDIRNLFSGNKNKKKLNFFFYKLLGIDINTISLSEVFTSYVFEEKNKSKFLLTRNNGLFLRDMFLGLDRNSTVCFIGGPLVEVGVLEKQQFLMLIKSASISRQLLGRKVVYFPHRREEINTVQQIKDITGWSINEYLEVPFELSLLKTGIPNTVVSFTSSVLSNMDTYQIDTNIISFVIPNKIFLKNGDFYQKIYDNYLNQSILLVKDFIKYV